MTTVLRSHWYLFIAIALAAFVFLGFARTYYLRPFFEVPPINLLMHLHSIVFSAWVALFVVQVRLVSQHNYRMHMRLGIAALVLAVLVFVVGLAASFQTAAAPGMRPMGMTSQQFVLMPLTAIFVFFGFVVAAFLLRKRSELHKRFMMLAMIAVLGPPAARLIRAAGLLENFLLIQTVVAAAFVILCLISDWKKQRAFHPVYAIGGTLLVLSWPMRAWVARTSAWESAGAWMANVTQGS
jgi:hypothetical protein